MAPGGRWGKERERVERRVLVLDFKHGKVAARARQVAAGAAKASHAARTASTVTVTTLFIKFKFPILPQTYH